jgi:hypothetical protein
MSSTNEVRILKREDLGDTQSALALIGKQVSWWCTHVAPNLIRPTTPPEKWKKMKPEPRLAELASVLRGSPELVASLCAAPPPIMSLPRWCLTEVLHAAVPEKCPPNDPLVSLEIAVRQIHPDAGFPKFPSDGFIVALLALHPNHGNPLREYFGVEALCSHGFVPEARLGAGPLKPLIVDKPSTWKPSPSATDSRMKEVSSFPLVVGASWVGHIQAGEVYENAAGW